MREVCGGMMFIQRGVPIKARINALGSTATKYWFFRFFCLLVLQWESLVFFGWWVRAEGEQTREQRG